MAKFGYNWDTGSISEDRAIASMRASGAEYHLMMIAPHSFFLGEGDIQNIKRVLDALPNCTLIIRVFNDLQGNWSVYPKATEYQAHWKWIRSRIDTSRLIFDDPSNEPNLAGTDVNAAKLYVNRCLALVEAAHNAGVKLAIGAFSIGTPHESLLDTVYLPLWKLCAKYGMGISAHLYAPLPHEVELAGYRIMLDATSAKNQMKGKWPLGEWGFLIARSYRLISIYERYGLGIPELYITECDIDQIGDVPDDIKQAWRDKYGIWRYQYDPRGVQSWETFLKEMFPDMEFDIAVAYLLSHARKNIFYHSAFKALCLFALNAQWGYKYAGHDRDGTNKEAGSNYDDTQFDRFRALLLPAVNAEALEQIPPIILPPPPPMAPPNEVIEIPEETPMPTMISVKMKSNATATNIRTAPNTFGIVVGKIGAIYKIGLVQSDYQAKKDAKGWVELEIEGVHGFSSAQYLDFEAIAPTPPPAPDETVYFLDFLGQTEAVNKAVIERLIEIADNTKRYLMSVLEE